MDRDFEIEQTVLITDEEGRQHTFRLSDILEVRGRTYAVLLPATEDLDSEGVIFRLEENEEGIVAFVPVQDDVEWQEVESAFHRRLFEEDEE